MTRGKGYLPDVEDVRDWKAFSPDPMAPRLAASPLGAAAVQDFGDLVQEVHDQGRTGSCVAQAGCSAAELWARLRGVILPALSRRAAYDWGRGGQLPLLDVGCTPRVAMQRWREWGFCSDETWPWDEGAINAPLPLDVIEAGAHAKLVSYFRVDGAGDVRCAQVRWLLSEGYPVIFGQDCYEDLENYTGGVLPDVPAGAILGGHMTTIVGYKPGSFRVLNSWGTGWGEDGFYRMSDARFGGDSVRDVYAFTCAPLRVA